jgi:hypothetical protein
MRLECQVVGADMGERSLGAIGREGAVDEAFVLLLEIGVVQAPSASHRCGSCAAPHRSQGSAAGPPRAGRCLRSSTMLRLLRFRAMKLALAPSLGAAPSASPRRRASSPIPGGSTLTTEAPRSPRTLGRGRAGEVAREVDDPYPVQHPCLAFAHASPSILRKDAGGSASRHPHRSFGPVLGMSRPRPPHAPP